MVVEGNGVAVQPAPFVGPSGQETNAIAVPESCRAMVDPSVRGRFFGGAPISFGTATDGVQLLFIPAILPTALNTRKHADAQRLELMSRSIQTNGIHTPIKICLLPNQKPGTATIIAGHRRFYAACAAAAREGCATSKVLLPCEFDARIILSLNDFRIELLKDNLYREDPTPVDVAYGISALMQDPENRHTQEEVAGKLGLTKSRVNQYLKLLHLPKEVQELVNLRLLAETSARAIADFSAGAAAQIELAERTVKLGLSTNKVVKSIQAATPRTASAMREGKRVRNKDVATLRHVAAGDHRVVVTMECRRQTITPELAREALLEVLNRFGGFELPDSQLRSSQAEEHAPVEEQAGSHLANIWKVKEGLLVDALTQYFPKALVKSEKLGWCLNKGLEASLTLPLKAEHVRDFGISSSEQTFDCAIRWMREQKHLFDPIPRVNLLILMAYWHAQLERVEKDPSVQPTFVLLAAIPSDYPKLDGDTARYPKERVVMWLQERLFNVQAIVQHQLGPLCAADQALERAKTFWGTEGGEVQVSQKALLGMGIDLSKDLGEPLFRWLGKRADAGDPVRSDLADRKYIILPELWAHAALALRKAIELTGNGQRQVVGTSVLSAAHVPFSRAGISHDARVVSVSKVLSFVRDYFESVNTIATRMFPQFDTHEN